MSTTLQENNYMLSMQLPSKSESINLLENFIESLRKTYDISDEVYANILITLTEAVNNAIFHGNKSSDNKKVYLNLEIVNKRKLIFTIADEGDGFDYESVVDPTLEENLELQGGRGIFIIKHLADNFIFNKKGNEIELHFAM